MASVIRPLMIGEEVEFAGLIDRIKITRTEKFSVSEWLRFEYLVRKWYEDALTACTRNGVEGMHILLLEKRTIQVLITGNLDHFRIIRIAEELQEKLQIAFPNIFFAIFMDKVFFGEPGSDVG